MAASGTLIASAVPVMVVGPLAGVLIDRWQRPRRVALWANLVSVALILLLMPLAGVVNLPGLSTPPLGARLASIFVIVALASAATQFVRPATTVLTRDLVSEPDWTRASSLKQTAESIALLAGPPIAAPLLVAFGPEWALGVNAASFAIAYLAIRAIDYRDRPSHLAAAELESPPILQEFRAGLAFFARTRVLMTVTTALVIAVLGLGALNALNVFFLLENLDSSAKGYGILSAAYGGGMLAGAAISARLVPKLGYRRAIWLPLGLLGSLTVVYSQLTSFLPAVIIAAVIGVIITQMNVAVGPLIFQVTPRELLGRVTSTLNPLINAASIAGMLIGGALYSGPLRHFSAAAGNITFGPIDSIFLAVGLLCVAGAVYAYLNLDASGLEPEPIGAVPLPTEAD